jgi:hypothetical protein
VSPMWVTSPDILEEKIVFIIISGPNRNAQGQTLDPQVLTTDGVASHTCLCTCLPGEQQQRVSCLTVVKDPSA